MMLLALAAFAALSCGAAFFDLAFPVLLALIRFVFLFEPLPVFTAGFAAALAAIAGDTSSSRREMTSASFALLAGLLACTGLWRTLSVLLLRGCKPSRAAKPLA